MRKILSFLALLPTLALPAPWSSFSPTVSNLPGKNGTFEPATYTMLTYDDSTRTIVGFQTYNASGETPAYNQTIYSNNVFKLAYHYGASADTIRQLALTNWWTNISGSNSTTPNANFLTSPTPPDVHPYIGSRSGVLFHFGGLNQLIRDTITFHPDSVNLADNYINLPRFTPWGDRDAFRLITTGTLPTSLAANTTYWAIRVSETRIQLASSAANAAAGTAIDLQTSTGTGTHRLVKDTTDAFHYSGIWKLNLTSGIWTQIHTPRAIGWSRGPAHNVAQAVIWHRAQQRFWIHYGKNYPETPEYTWSFDPETDSLKELTTTGNKRSGLSPEIYTSAQSCTYDSRRARMWCWGGVDSLFEYGNTLWHLDTTGAWVEHADRPGNPRARFQHTLLYVRGATAATDSLLMCGGRTNGVDNRDCHKFCIQDSTWAVTDSLPTGNAHTYGVVDRVGDGTNSYVVIQQGTTWYEKQMGAADLQALSPATITDDPDPITVNEGATAGFSCTATGFPTPAYQWQKDGVNVVGGSGGTTASYTTPTLTAGDNGAAYRCIVSNSQGADTSAAAVLTVLTPPTITDDPDNVTVTEPAAAEFECAASGSPVLAYKWQRNGTDIPGETNPWYILDPTDVTDDGDLFRCIVSNAAGADTSTEAELTVESALSAPVVTVNPAHDTVLAPAAGEFSCTATGNPTPTYQWQRDGVDIGGATSSTYTTPATVYGDDGAAFRCIVTNSEGADTSTAGILTVNAAPLITVSPQSRTVLIGGSATFGVSVTGSPTLTYQWQEDGSDIVGATSATYTIPSAAEADSGKAFRVIVTNSYGADTSGAAILHVVDEIRRAKAGPRRRMGIGPR